jgi:hypothetical protein
MGETMTKQEREDIELVAEKVMGWSKGNGRYWLDVGGRCQVYSDMDKGGWNPKLSIEDSKMLRDRLAEMYETTELLTQQNGRASYAVWNMEEVDDYGVKPKDYIQHGDPDERVAVFEVALAVARGR